MIGKGALLYKTAVQVVDTLSLTFTIRIVKSALLDIDSSFFKTQMIKSELEKSSQKHLDKKFRSRGNEVTLQT